MLIRVLQTKFALNMISIIGLGLVKSSILVMYKNIFAVRKFQIIVYIVLAFVVGWTVSFSISHLLSDHRLHRTLLQQQLRRNGAHVFSSVGKYGQNSSYRSSTRTLKKTKLTMLIVYGRNRRHCHSHPSDPYGHEHQDGIEEEIGGHLHAHIGRGVS
jgi:hypothetical protein